MPNREAKSPQISRRFRKNRLERPIGFFAGINLATSRPGGGRRLNVLVARTRDMVHVPTSIPRREYAALAAVPDGEQAGWALLLYAYLRYAELLAEEFERDRERVAQLAAARRVGEVRVRPSATASLPTQALAKRLSPEGISSDVHWGNEGFGIGLALPPSSMFPWLHPATCRS